MEIILLERVKHLGEMGSVVTVKPGYARNFLLPKRKALRATVANRESFLTRKAEITAQNAEKLEQAQSIYAIMDKNFITIIRQAGEDGKLYGSVSPRDIADSISAVFAQQISHSDIVLTKPIKYVAVHEVNIALHSELQTTIYVNVARTESEASDAQKAFLAPPSSIKKSDE